MIVLLVVLAVAAETAITALIANAKGRSITEGVLLGLFLGLIGLVIEACLPSRHAAVRRAERRQSRQAVQAKAARPGLGTAPLRRGEAGRMLADLKRDQDR
jgi:type VI protein secretion system component VasK